jgi:hypothetical protein
MVTDFTVHQFDSYYVSVFHRCRQASLLLTLKRGHYGCDLIGRSVWTFHHEAHCSNLKEMATNLPASIIMPTKKRAKGQVGAEGDMYLIIPWFQIVSITLQSETFSVSKTTPIHHTACQHGMG